MRTCTARFAVAARCVTALVLLAGAVPASADVRLPAVLSDNMVLQQGKAAQIWGWADPNEKVTVRFRDAEASATTDAAGNWSVTLPEAATARYGGPDRLTVAGKNRLVRENILVGEVWVCSGQSNMDFTLAKTQKKYFAGVVNADAEIKAADYPQIRMFTADLAMTDERKSDVGGKWSVCSPSTAGDFSAVAYYFGRAIHRDRHVPVGLVTVSYGASTAQAWMSRETIAAEPEFKKLLDSYAVACRDWETGAAQERYRKARADWEKAAETAKADGKPAPRAPREPRDPHQDQHNPCVLFNGMVAPLLPLRVRGVIWYQGESNVATVDGYHALMRGLIRDWRREWAEPGLPFLQVQLAPNGEPDAAPRDSRTALVREAQYVVTRELPGVGCAVITDWGDRKDIHPHVKEPVGERLALLARRIAYGETGLVAEGPTFRALTVTGNRTTLTFENVGGGLECRAVTNPKFPVPGDKLVGFAVAGADGKFYAADARIVGKDVIEVSAPEVAEPRSVRYGWANFPVVNLFNREGLPACPFRTDSKPP